MYMSERTYVCEVKPYYLYLKLNIKKCLWFLSVYVVVDDADDETIAS